MPDILEKYAATSINGGMEIPYIERRYYLFIDRHSQLQINAKVK